MEASAVPTGTATAAQLNERRLLLLFGAVELCWLAGLGYVLSVIL